MVMSLRENITAVIETCFSETKDEIQEVAINRILELIRNDKADRKTENSSENPNNCKPQTNRIADKKPTPIRDFMVNGKVKDEPQTDCGDFADRLAYERGVKHAWEVAQKVFNSTVTFYEAEDVAKQIDKDINVRSKDEPQTDTEIAKAIVHKMIDDAVIAEDAYPDLRQKMHDAVDEYEPQTDCAWK